MAITFIDWNDKNAHAAAQCALRLMQAGYDDQGAIAEASRRYSAPRYDVARWIRHVAEQH
jgi:hypothetical protein